MNFAKYDKCWFALHVRPNYEQLAATILGNKGYEQFVPQVERFESAEQRRTPSRAALRILYPGYVFCRFDAQIGGPIVTTPGVIRIVGNGVSPIPIADEEIDKIKLIIQSRLPAYPWPFVHAGNRVRITEGPLNGLEGIIIKVKSVHRLIVSIDFLQRSAAVEIDASWVEAASMHNLNKKTDTGRVLQSGFRM